LKIREKEKGWRLDNFFMNFRLKENMDWNSLLAKFNCYEMEHWRHLLYFTLIASWRLMHRYGCHKL